MQATVIPVLSPDVTNVLKIFSCGIETKTPREALKQAYKIDWLDNEHAWLQMLRDRNETSQIYDEEKARSIHKNIISYFPEMKKTYTYLKAKFHESRSESFDD
ncbi:HI0074 family nucleotidyltransferase substrate-binding subunit [Lentibacillus sp. Marseille-P4043]|uniref:HI0074 family nucleotidyltransferase substrate-binding subunit n=1 Tax=Lentibacillus sp. Marseille-P4043 TaxID=2040293 RepID=UPI000D0B5209|nr:HI0074 family nucleotidyltransferase substrate-binding subunit [Lentibacillus sp. Marseille-P4043]